MSRWVRRGDALWRRTATGVVVLGAAAERPRAVIGPAASLWDLLAEPIDERDAFALLAGRHDTDVEVVARDLGAVLETWQRDGAIEELGVTDDELRPVVRVLAALAVGGSVPAVGALDASQWTRLETIVRARRLEPQLAAATRSGALPATSEQIDAAESMHLSAMATVLVLDRLLVDVADRFDAADIPLIVLKGPATARLDHADPSHRAYGDVDVLVPSRSVDRAAACLGATGGRRAHAEPRPGFDRRFGKGMSFRLRDGLEVDVHRTLVLGPFGLAIDLDDLWAGREVVVVGGRALEALDRPRRFVHSCLHAALGRARPREVPLIDLVLSAPRTDADLGAAVAITRRWRADAAVLDAVATASHELGWSPPSELTAWLARLQPTAQQRRWLAGYRGARRSSARLTLTATEALPAWGDRVEYLRAVAWPSQAGVASAARRVSRGVRSFVGRSPG